MRECPFKNCGQPIPDAMFACGRHWHTLSADQQAHIWSLYRDYTSDLISIDVLRRAQQRVLDECQGVR